MRVEAETALSRLTFEPCLRLAKFVLLRVSGATPTLKVVLSNSVTVRQVPLMEMLSPSIAPSRIGPQSEIVRDVPPPPDVDESRSLRLETADDLLISFNFMNVEQRMYCKGALKPSLRTLMQLTSNRLHKSRKH